MPWLEDLRNIHCEANRFNWDSHLSDLNARYNFSGDYRLSTADEGIPPAWFNGDVEAIQPEEWVLVISLNPAKPPAGYYGDALTAEKAWDFWRMHNTNWWYGRFFRPMVQLAATSLGEPIPSRNDAEKAFATNRMVFVEICPYASRKYAVNDQTRRELAKTDKGFDYARMVLDVLLNQAQPALVLVNGQDAISEFQSLRGEHLDWSCQTYESSHLRTRKGGPKPLWHYQGRYATSNGMVPIGGFKFLRKPANHNSNIEIEMLGQALNQSAALRNIKHQ